MVQAMEAAATKFILPELEQYLGSIHICPCLDSLSTIYIWQSDLDKVHSNGMFGTGVLVPNGTLVLCAFALKEDAWDISDPKLACFWAWVHHSQKVYTVQDTTDQAISLWQEGRHTVALAQLQVDSHMAPSPRTLPEVRVYFPPNKYLSSPWGRVCFLSSE